MHRGPCGPFLVDGLQEPGTPLEPASGVSADSTRYGKVSNGPPEGVGSSWRGVGRVDHRVEGAVDAWAFGPVHGTRRSRRCPSIRVCGQRQEGQDGREVMPAA
jgi:hypothetical protein